MQKVSLIMTTYNSKENFSKSIESAVSQDYPCIELVVVDGESTDGTLEMIKRYAAKISADGDNASGNDVQNREISLKWISEPDKGIYDGMNKGIRLSTGDIIAVFNDLFTSTHAISDMVSAIDKDGSDGSYADLAYMDGEICKRFWKMDRGSINSGWMPAHPTMYLKREVYDEYGEYDLSYHSSSDYEFMLRILKDEKVHLSYVPEVIIEMFYGGTSNNGLSGYPRNIHEAYLALKANGISFPMIVIALRIIRTLKQYRRASAYTESRKDAYKEK